MVVTRITHQPVCYVQTPISDEPSPEDLKESMDMVCRVVIIILEICVQGITHQKFSNHVTVIQNILSCEL